MPGKLTEPLSEQIRRVYYVSYETGLPATDADLVRWIAAALALEREVEKLRGECGKAEE